MLKRYDLDWPEGTDDLQVEMGIIRKGGQWTGKDGKVYGNGLSFHYEAMRHILWPHLDVHRWSELCRDEILRNKITVIMGPKSSSKTHSAAWTYLCEYLIYPDETCVLVSSTDLRGLELRVWGEIKSLFQQAKEKFPYLPGYLIDSKHAIATDDLFEDDAVRDLRKGMMGIPCMQNGKFVGLGKYCFCSGTLVDTPTGPRPIESIKVGDLVISAIGPRKVLACANHIAPALVRVRLSNGKTIDCTPNHRFLTSLGWRNAELLTSTHRLISTDETLRILRNRINSPRPISKLLQFRLPRIGKETPSALPCVRENNNDSIGSLLQQGVSEIVVGKEMQLVQAGVHSDGSENDLLFNILCDEMEALPTGYSSENGTEQRLGEGGSEHQQSDTRQSQGTRTSKETCESSWAETERMDTLRCQNANLGRENLVSPIPECDLQLQGNNGGIVQDGKCNLLQNRFGFSEYPFSGRGGRSVPSSREPKNKGHQADQVSESTWVDSVEVHQQIDNERYSESEGGYRVYNLEVEGHPSYSVENCVVHNCGIKQKRMRLIADEASLMSSSFLSAFANLDGNEDFRAIILGNPNDTMDPLGRAAEPKDGWSSHLEPKKTEVWDTKFMGGRCVNLIGTDSPNFDFPASEPTRYKYLISREKIANTLSFFPKDSAEYYTQCIGSMKVGLLSRRVITREMCVQFKAMEPVTWAGTGLTKIGGLDSAYGGDRCIGGHIEFGQAVGGKIVINVFPPVNVPVRVSADVSPEEQISIWVRDYCEANFIPPENFFHDSTGRGTLGTTLARVWSAMCNPVEFGGSATARPVALDFYVIDPRTHKRRLKLCNEHYSKFVTELWFAVSYAIQAGQVRGMTDDLVDEGSLRSWDKVAGDRISVETKQDMKERVGRSPDLFDFLAICVEGARRRGFNIQKMSSESEADGTDRSWWDAAASKANASKRGRVLALTQ